MTVANPQVKDIERITQNRVVQFFKDTLGYEYLGNREYRENNSNIEVDLLKSWLVKQNKYSDEIINKAIFYLQKIASDQQKPLYDINREVYEKLRYGQNIKEQENKP
jgi:type I restriction enzyme R subunit